jgi:APA family basic amino acid/polyamine antiporter
VNGQFGWSGILRASGVIFFAYVGFDSVSTAAQEARNPQRDMPFGLLMGLTICTLLYILMAGTLTGLMPYAQLNDAAPVVAAMEAHPQLRWLSVFVSIGALAGLTSVILVMILGQARILLAMSRDGLLPLGLGKVHPRFRTPYVATALVGGFGAIMAGLLPIDLLAELVSIGTLIAFMMVCIGVLVLRYTRPTLHRPFRVKWIWFCAMGGVFFCGMMALRLGAGTWYRLVGWTAVGLVVYFFYSRHHSRLRQSAHPPRK